MCHLDRTRSFIDPVSKYHEPERIALLRFRPDPFTGDKVEVCFLVTRVEYNRSISFRIIPPALAHYEGNSHPCVVFHIQQVSLLQS